MQFPPIKPRSRQAHEATEFARDKGLVDAMRTALFQAYFVANRDLGDPDVLVDVGASVGLDAEELRAALADGRYRPRVEEMEALAARIGVGAVPTIVFGDAVGVEGAQPYEVLHQAYEEALRRLAEDEAPVG